MVAMETLYCRASSLFVALDGAAWISARILGVVVACLYSLMSMSLLLDELLKKFSRGEQRIAPGGDPIIRDLTPSLNGDFIVLAVLPEQPKIGRATCRAGR